MTTIWAELLSAFFIAVSSLGKPAPELRPPASNEQIKSLETAIKNKLPPDYASFLKTSNGITNYFPGYNHPGTAELISSVETATIKYGSYARMLRVGVLFDDEIGFGVTENQVLMVSNYDGNPGALYLVVDEKSDKYGAVVSYWPGDSSLYPSWAAFLQAEINKIKQYG